jgi:hypothetical protein
MIENDLRLEQEHIPHEYAMFIHPFMDYREPTDYPPILTELYSTI